MLAAERDMCQFEDADSSSANSLCLAWLFSKCTGSLWDEVGAVEVETIIIMLYLFGEDVQAVVRQHYVLNWEFNFQLVD